MRYNKRVGRRGTLWEDRFKSVLVQGDWFALSTMAALLCTVRDLRREVIIVPSRG
jgi:hypothetical protein